MNFQVQKATREKIYVKTALMAPSGGGKTYSALRVATGMAEEIGKARGTVGRILLANTENSRGRYYANEFSYDIVDVDPPHDPEKYVSLIKFAVANEYDILIMDSTSHEWEGSGGCLDIQRRAGGRYQDWDKVTPRHNAFINEIADSPIHIIATMRGKDQYDMEKSETGRTTVTKLGIGAKQRDGFEYEFTLTFLIDQKTNTATVQKDNTHLFDTKGAVKLSEVDGISLIKWANSSDGYTPKNRNDDIKIVPKVEPEDDMDTIKIEIGNVFKEKMNKFDKEVLYAIVKEISGVRNFNSIKNVSTAQDVLTKLKEYEG